MCTRAQVRPLGYEGEDGPSHRGDLNPDYAPCKNGHHQSPIDIRNPQEADLPAIRFDYNDSPLDIVDNGHTIMINYGTAKEKEKQELLEIERFSKLYRHDARPTQPLYDRIVQESE